jgi:DNA-binding MarR family transcriptional regulator
MADSHADLVRALAHDKGNVSTNLKGLEAKGLVTIARTPGVKAEAVDLTPMGRTRVAVVHQENASLTTSRTLHGR